MIGYDRCSIDGCCEIIGIAGNIGAGKSVVSRILRCNGFIVYDCDKEASDIMNYDEKLRLHLIEILGQECYTDKGNVNKRYVSSQIFNDEEIRNKVNAVVHEAVRNDFMRIASKNNEKVFVESAIMASSGLDKLCRQIWVVEASETTRLKRVMLRNNLSEKEVMSRMETQRGELSKLPEDKVVIIENDDNSIMLRQVLKLAFGKVEAMCFEIPLQDGI